MSTTPIQATVLARARQGLFSLLPHIDLGRHHLPALKVTRSIETLGLQTKSRKQVRILPNIHLKGSKEIYKGVCLLK